MTLFLTQEQIVSVRCGLASSKSSVQDFGAVSIGFTGLFCIRMPEEKIPKQAFFVSASIKRRPSTVSVHPDLHMWLHSHTGILY